MSAKNLPPYVPHITGEVAAVMGVEGTLGTADTAGTARVLPIGMNPQTGALYVQDLAGASGTSNVSIANGTVTEVSNLAKGTVTRVEGGTVGLITRVGNVGTLELGSVVVNSLPQVSVGTIPQVSVGTIPNVNIATGTQQTLGTVGVLNTGTLAQVTSISSVAEVVKGTTTLVTRTGNVGTLELGSVVVTNTPSVNVATGTQQTLGTVGVINNGTLAQVTSLSNLASGTLLALASGTVTGGTLQNLATGTITSVAEVVKGTTTLVSTVTTVSNLTNGSVNILTGTVTRVSNLGTLESGTTQINKTPVQIGTSYHTRGTTGAAVWGTLIAASGAGTYQYVSNVDVVVTSGTVDVAVTNIGIGGSTGAGVLARGNFPAGGGIAKQFDPVTKSGTNGTLSFWMGGAGTVDVTIHYWQGV